MSEMIGAARQLERIFYILPKAARAGGAGLEELAEALGVESGQIFNDIRQVTNRAYYQPAGMDNLLLEIEAGRISLVTPGAFDRPVRLSTSEAVCLGLALRGRLLGRWGPGTDAELDSASLQLVNSLETSLSEIPTEEALALIEAEDLRPDPMGIREVLRMAAEGREECRIRYLKPGEDDPEVRTVQPFALIHGEGHWYLLGRCASAEDIRTFRVDRVLEAEPTGKVFPEPDSFDPEAHVQGGRVFRSGQRMDVSVRYSPAIARWIAEREDARPAEDGSITVTHPVADPDWVVRHVLQYGPDAEVLEPEEVRMWVREAAESMEQLLRADLARAKTRGKQ